MPNEIVDHPSIQASARRKNKDASRLILDQNYHHAAILKLKSRQGRGRSDITHQCLLLALGSPLNMDNQLKCCIHTRDDHVIDIQPHARLPRNSERFVSLLEQLYQESRVPIEGPALMTLKRASLRSLMGELQSDRVIALTRVGVKKKMPEVAKEMALSKRPVMLVGAFSEGHFSHRTLESANEKYSIDSRSLEASTVVARAIYDYEMAIGLERFPNPRN